MFYHASIIKEIKPATFLIDTFVIAPLNDELCYEKGEIITHFAIEHRQNLQYTSFAKNWTEKKCLGKLTLKDYRKHSPTLRATICTLRAWLRASQSRAKLPRFSR